ncbi:MAG: heme ABC exporter ATP-binding protein CcmA, partial [Zoogloeaceae bacterium]|nr:heme ABC exporter ATP-binding protein CcmA [Zoogloeaceae bacterium]
PVTGQIRWRGTDIRRLAGDFYAELCFLGHQNAIKEELTPLENLVDAARFAGLAQNEATVLAALAQVGLAGREDLLCRDLSQGQKRRVALARLVFETRPLWVLDEPFVALDAHAVAWLAGLIGRHAAAGGLVVLTTHQPVDIPGGVLRELSLGEARS